MIRREWRELGFIKRWEVLRRVTVQSVAEHQYFVAVYSKLIGEAVGYTQQEISDAVWLALTHDLEEITTGDIPSPAKRYAITDRIALIRRRIFRILGIRDAEYSDKVRSLVKLADIIESMMYLATEKQLGNGSLGRVMEEIVERVGESIKVMYSKGYITSGWTSHSLEGAILRDIHEHSKGVSITLKFGEELTW